MNQELTRAARVAIAFQYEEQSLLRRLAMTVIARYAKEAAAAVPAGRLHLWPALWRDPALKIARRFRLCDFASCILYAYYNP